MRFPLEINLKNKIEEFERKVEIDISPDKERYSNKEVLEILKGLIEND